MSNWSVNGNGHAILQGAEGELVSIRIAVEPKSLERLLDVLACLDFPINPELSHHDPVSVVQFPAWAGRIPGVREALRRAGFDPSCVSCRSMVEVIQPPNDGRTGALRATA